MAYNNINLWFAKNTNGKIVTIDEVDKELKNTYYCPLCGSEVIARQGDIMSWHFAHIDKSKCDSESMVHFWIKNKLLEVGDTFKIKTDEELEFVVKDILIEQNYSVGNKIYNPDITIITECGKTIYLEVANTNKKKVEEYLDIWIELGNIVVEVDSKDLINSQGKLEFKSLYYEGKCFNVNNKEDREYYDSIGKYKEQLKEQGLYENKKEEIRMLDWFWADINKYLQNKIEISELSNEIQAIEDNASREVIVSILRKNRCTKVIKDYIEYNKQKFKQELKNDYDGFDYVISKERLVYDRIYKGFIIDIYYNKVFIYHGEIEMNYCNIEKYIKENLKPYCMMLKLKSELKNYFEIEDKYELHVKKYYEDSYLNLYNVSTKEDIYSINYEKIKDNIDNIKNKMIYVINKDKEKILFETLKSDIIANLKENGHDIIVNEVYGSIREYITFDVKYEGLKHINIKINKDKNAHDNIRNIVEEYNERKNKFIYLYGILKEYEDKSRSVKNSYKIRNLNNEISIRHKGDSCFNKKYEEISDVKEILNNEIFKKCLIEDLEDYKDYELLKDLEDLFYERFKKVEKNNSNIYFYVNVNTKDRILNINRRYRLGRNRSDIEISEIIPNNTYDIKEVFNCVMNKVSEKMRIEIFSKKEE